MNNIKLGVNAVLLTDVISPLLDKDGWPYLTAQEGDKVFIINAEPLMVKKVDNGVVFHVKEEWIRTTAGRPRLVD